MATTKKMIREWLESYKDSGATHLVIVCDTFSYEDYPVPVMPGDKLEKVEKEHSGNMQKVMEIYNFSMDIEEQLNKEGRVFNR